MLPKPVFATFVILAALATGPVGAEGFKFSQPDEADRAESEARESRIAEQLSTPCRADLKGKKIMVVIGEARSNGVIYAQQQNYGPHFQAINTRLRGLGLRSYTPEEIRRQIAQAEIDAYFRNDPDAALAASKRLGASFVLRGLISSQAQKNPMMNVNQVSVNMDFNLAGVHHEDFVA
jgi:ABC-type nitrate/sulfonate/bicarbonate transport system substrate-binding protein